MKKSIVATLLGSLLSLTASAQYAAPNYSNQYVQKPGTFNPSKDVVNIIKAEQEALNNGAVEVIDNSLPGRWVYETQKKTEGKSSPNNMDVCITQEMINKNKVKQIGNMFIPEEYKNVMSCKSSFDKKSKTRGNFKSTCITQVLKENNDNNVLLEVDGNIESLPEKLNVEYNVVSTFKINGETKEIKESFISKGKRVGNCTTYDKN